MLQYEAYKNDYMHSSVSVTTDTKEITIYC